MTGNHTGNLQLDVRSIPRPQRHGMIFTVLDGLEPGETFTLVNDHEPAGLLYQLNRIAPGVFSWRYLVQGPAEWQVVIGREEEGDAQ